MIPKHDAERRRCIQVDCGITITRPFLEQRLAVFQNPSDAYVIEFESLYGAAHRLQVLAWFQQALAEESASAIRSN